MNINTRLWIVLIAEHVLLLIKVRIAFAFCSVQLIVALTTALQILLSSLLPTIDEDVMFEHEHSM